MLDHIDAKAIPAGTSGTFTFTLPHPYPEKFTSNAIDGSDFIHHTFLFITFDAEETMEIYCPMRGAVARLPKEVYNSCVASDLLYVPVVDVINPETSTPFMPTMPFPPEVLQSSGYVAPPKTPFSAEQEEYFQTFGLGELSSTERHEMAEFWKSTPLLPKEYNTGLCQCSKSSCPVCLDALFCCWCQTGRIMNASKNKPDSMSSAPFDMLLQNGVLLEPSWSTGVSVLPPMCCLECSNDTKFPARLQ